MYHCHLRIALCGDTGRELTALRELAPLPGFRYSFTSDARKADVVFAVRPDLAWLKALLRGRKPECRVYVLTEARAALAEVLGELADVWPLPMTEEELSFRLRGWQERTKERFDLWETRQFWQATINSVPLMIWYKDKEGIHERVNDNFCQTVNKPRERVEGKDHYAIWDVDPEDPENREIVCVDSEQVVMEARKTCVFDETVAVGDDIKLLTTYKSPLFDLDGSVMGTVGVAMDVTQERAYEEEIVRKNTSLEAIFTSLDCGVICHSLDGREILSVNKEALRILGYDSQEALLADGFYMVARSVLDEDKPALQASIQSLKREGDSVSVEYRVRHEDGSLVHVLGSVKLIREAGEVCVRRFMLDVTAQKLQEAEEQRRQEELTRALTIDYSMVCFYDLRTGAGLNLRVDESLACGPFTFREGQSLLELLDAYIETEVLEEDREHMREVLSVEYIQRELADRPFFYVNYRVRHGKGVLYYLLNVVKIDELGGVVLGFRSVDEETRKEMDRNRLLEDALWEANRANRAKTTFLSNMSHDIRTPMNAIMGFTSLALSHIGEREQVKEYLRKVMDSGSHMLSLINDVLDMSRIESGKVQLEEAPCSLPELLKNIQSITQTEMRAKNHRFTMDTEGIRHGQVLCDKLRLNQVLLNVLTNAIKYTPEGGVISLRVSETPGKTEEGAVYEFRVRDNGIGMSPDFLAQIFEPFERETNSQTSGIQGTGLGMAITRNIVDLMGGDVMVDSEPDEGTEVSITVPLRFSTEQEAVGESHSAERRVGSYTGRILLAEDNELNREIAVTILSDAGFTVDEAVNGEEAVELVRKAPPDYYRLVLMDVQMPVMNGYEATRAIRTFAAGLPIIAMTANAFEEDRRAALDSGMNGHIAKPVDVNVLFDTLDKLFSERNNG